MTGITDVAPPISLQLLYGICDRCIGFAAFEIRAQQGNLLWARTLSFDCNLQSWKCRWYRNRNRYFTYTFKTLTCTAQGPWSSRPGSSCMACWICRTWISCQRLKTPSIDYSERPVCTWEVVTAAIWIQNCGHYSRSKFSLVGDPRTSCLSALRRHLKMWSFFVLGILRV